MNPDRKEIHMDLTKLITSLSGGVNDAVWAIVEGFTTLVGQIVGLV